HLTRFFRIDVKPLKRGENVLAVQALRKSASVPFSLALLLKAECNFDEDNRKRCQEAFEAFTAVASGGNSSSLEAYFQGRLLEGCGSHREALAKYQEAGALSTRRPEPYLRIAECLRAVGQPWAGLEVLRQTLESGSGQTAILWDSWVRTALVDLQWGPEEALDEFPARAPGSQEEREDAAGDLFWLLSELVEGEPLRINCGGGDVRSVA